MRYGVILADPPWFYNNRKAGGERKNKTKLGGGAMKHYPLMKDHELIAMASMINDLAAENCALFMWATMPRLDFGIDLLKAWGFRYATNAFTWIKTKQDGSPIYGPGYYTASNTELVLLGIRGKMEPTKKMMPSVIHSIRQEHSRKPDIHHAINQLYPEANKIELFARRAFPGWDAWGNEIESEQIAQAL